MCLNNGAADGQAQPDARGRGLALAACEFLEYCFLAAGRKAGLKDVKVVGFSPTHTALKFVIPVENR